MDEEEIKLTEKEGAIVLRDDAPPELYAPIGVGESSDNIRFTIAFILYAVEREDWVKEFGEFVNKIQERRHKQDAEERRSKFQIIKGEKK